MPFDQREPGSPTPRRLTAIAVLGSVVLVAPSLAALATPAAAPPARLAPASASKAAAAVLATERVELSDTGKKKPRTKTKKRIRFARSSEAIVRIKSVRISRFVYRGGQRTIDKDRVAHYTGWRDTFTKAGRPGVYWLAAHNYGRSGPFHRLLRIKKGAKVKVLTRSGRTYVYRVNRLRVVDTVVPRTVVWGKWGPDTGPPRAVLQTCKGSKRLLVFATLVTKTT